MKKNFVETLDAKMRSSINSLHILAVILDPTLREFSMCTARKDQAVFRTQAATMRSKSGKLDIFSSFRSQQGERSLEFQESPTKASITTELQQYNSIPSPCSENFDLLKFWHERKSAMPTLARIARSVYVSPAFSSETERHFSAFNSGFIMRPIRNQLEPEAVDAISVSLEYYKNL